jgi:hypothetical protein
VDVVVTHHGLEPAPRRILASSFGRQVLAA